MYPMGPMRRFLVLTPAPTENTGAPSGATTSPTVCRSSAAPSSLSPTELRSAAERRAEAAEAAQEFNCALVMKVDSPDILHKSDIGGVELNIHGPEEARAAWDKMDAQFTDFLTNKRRVIEKALSGGKTFYRLRAMNFADIFTIGIEHAGYASQSSWSAGLLQASADLSCDISDDWSIPRDINHFVGHGQLQPYNRTDPGANWPWTDYLNRINTACGSTPPPSGTIIVDSNNSLNDTNVGYISQSSNWSSSSHSTDYETGYWWAQTAAVSDGATFWFYLPTAATKTIDAWWVAGSTGCNS